MLQINITKGERVRGDSILQVKKYLVGAIIWIENSKKCWQEIHIFLLAFSISSSPISVFKTSIRWKIFNFPFIYLKKFHLAVQVFFLAFHIFLWIRFRIIPQPFLKGAQLDAIARGGFLSVKDVVSREMPQYVNKFFV